MKKLFWNALIILNFYLILYFWFTNSNVLIASSRPGDFYIALGRLFGLLSELALLISLLLISRFGPIEKEYGFDKLIGFHKWLGFATGIFIISHPLFLTIGYGQVNKINYFTQFLNFLTDWEEIIPALIATLIIIFTAIVSIKKIRSKFSYELWYFSHLPLYIAVAIAFNHQIETGDLTSGGALTYWFILNILTAGLVISYRFLRPSYFFTKHRFTVEKVVKENDSVYSIYLTGKELQDFRFKSGQFATLIFLQKGLWFHHPFSFSDSYNVQYLRFSIKAFGDFTSKINQLKAGTKVWIDGPVGTFTLSKANKNKYLFIAGGIGITPILSIIKSLTDKNSGLLLYSNKTEVETVFKEEITKSGIKTHFFYTAQGESNRINIAKISELCPDYLDRDIYLCGSVKMTSGLVKDLRKTAINKGQIHLEKFDY